MQYIYYIHIIVIFIPLLSPAPSCKLRLLRLTSKSVHGSQTFQVKDPQIDTYEPADPPFERILCQEPPDNISNQMT